MTVVESHGRKISVTQIHSPVHTLKKYYSSTNKRPQHENFKQDKDEFMAKYSKEKTSKISKEDQRAMLAKLPERKMDKNTLSKHGVLVKVTKMNSILHMLHQYYTSDKPRPKHKHFKDDRDEFMAKYNQRKTKKISQKDLTTMKKKLPVQSNYVKTNVFEAHGVRVKVSKMHSLLHTLHQYYKSDKERPRHINYKDDKAEFMTKYENRKKKKISNEDLKTMKEKLPPQKSHPLEIRGMRIKVTKLHGLLHTLHKYYTSDKERPEHINYKDDKTEFMSRYENRKNEKISKEDLESMKKKLPELAKRRRLPKVETPIESDSTTPEIDMSQETDKPVQPNLNIMQRG